MRFPLSAKILGWLFLNLGLLGLVIYAFARAQYGLGLDSLLMGQAGDRIQVMTDVLTRELNRNARNDWNELLHQFSDLYHVRLLVVRNDGVQLAGETTTLPPELVQKLRETRGPLAGQLGPPRDRIDRPPFDREPADDAPNQPPFDRRGPRLRPPGAPEDPAVPGTAPKFVLRTSNPTRYWVGVRVRVMDKDHPGPAPHTLLAVSDSLRGGGLFFDFTPWITVGFGCVLFCVLFWLPLVGGITRSLSQITRATEQIAAGRFEARVATKRRDELGRLGQAINQMASRLSGFVTGQRRFLGDIAHELCSPIARIQMALGILEQRADEKQKAYVDDLREEVQEMSSLVNELLSFSKASLEPAAVKLQPVELRPIAERAANRENASGAEVRVEVPTELKAVAEPELLQRSLANLVRNAIRYAGQAGPITVSARQEKDQVLISVTDSGSGVPEESLAQLFDPFYRIETSRNRELGGVGLGLAIVKTCIETCQGTVRCRNLKPAGFEVIAALKAA